MGSPLVAPPVSTLKKARAPGTLRWAKYVVYRKLSGMNCYPKITCPTCGNPDIKTSGRNAQGVQRYRCWNPGTPRVPPKRSC